MADDILKEIRERKDYTTSAWQDIRKEAAEDMKYVSGDPWTADDKKQRAGRPTIAPEEMGQYFNQVINHIWANPRGVKFAPVGNGANDKGARFYQDKMRETEYRSHAKIAYTTAASDAIQRSYGWVRIVPRYANARSSNQELFIEACPDPDMIEPDPDAKRADSSDMQFCFNGLWEDQAEFKRKYPKAKVRNFSDWATQHPKWIAGNKVLVTEYWTVSTRKRQLLLVQPPAPMQQRMIAPSPTPNAPPMQVFEDEIPQGAQVLRELREVGYPEVKMYLTNGLEILHEQEWRGKYIPFISCFGKVLYIPKGGQTERVMLSMTRFGREPWKAYCYACCQELEVLSMVPKAPVHVWKGQLRGIAKDWQESAYQPKAYLESWPTDEEGRPYPSPPERINYAAGEHLQAIEIVKEGFRRAIQSAMGSNFLPTQAQRRNEKSGVALEKMEQAASTGTFHFINNYEDMIRQVGVVFEDLIPHYYDYAGETSVMGADDKAQSIQINTDHPDAISTKGDYLVTVSTGPSNDSERDALRDFIESLVGNLQIIAGISGQKAAAAVFAKAIRLRNGGAEMDALADIIEPPEYKQQDGQEPPNPQMMALQSENQQLKGVLQQAAQEKQAKVVEQQGKLEIVKVQEQADMVRSREANETKLAVAELGAKVDRLSLFLEERARLSADHVATADRVHQAVDATKDRVHERTMAQQQHEQALQQAAQQHQQALEQGDQGIAGQLAVQDAAPQPEAGV